MKRHGESNMKHAAEGEISALSRVADLERDIALLKSSLLKTSTPSSARVVKLKGVLKGVDVTEEDIAAARRSLHSTIAP